jgi:hypothetical protein
LLTAAKPFRVDPVTERLDGLALENEACDVTSSVVVLEPEPAVTFITIDAHW